MTKLFITEDVSEVPIGWYLSFLKPEFQGGETIKIDRETAMILLKSIPIVLDYIERWNKQDKEEDVAEAARALSDLILISN